MVRLAEGVAPDVGDTCVSCPSVCPTVNLSEGAGHERNGRVVAVWPVTARGKRT